MTGSPAPKRDLGQVVSWFRLTEAEVFWLSLVAAVFLLGLGVLAWRNRTAPGREPPPPRALERPGAGRATLGVVRVWV